MSLFFFMANVLFLMKFFFSGTIPGETYRYKLNSSCSGMIPGETYRYKPNSLA
jgi:hypothetical protein